MAATMPNDAPDAGIAGVTVALTPQAGPALRPKSTGVDGTFVIPNVPAGPGKISYSNKAYVKDPTPDEYRMPANGDGKVADCLLWPREKVKLDIKVIAENLKMRAARKEGGLTEVWNEVMTIRLPPADKVRLAQKFASDDSAPKSGDFRIFVDADAGRVSKAQDLLSRSITDANAVPSQRTVQELNLPTPLFADVILWAFTSALSHNDFRVNRLQFDPCVAEFELPVHSALLGVAALVPCGRF